MFALKPQRRAALPALRSRQTQARPSSSSTSFSRSRCPLYREPTYLSFSDIVGPSYNRSQPVLVLILSAWKMNSANFAGTEFSEVEWLLLCRPARAVIHSQAHHHLALEYFACGFEA